MYVLDPKHSGMYRRVINGKPIKEHVKQLQVGRFVRCDRYNVGFTVKAVAMDGKVVEFETTGAMRFDEIINILCDKIVKLGTKGH